MSEKDRTKKEKKHRRDKDHGSSSLTSSLSVNEEIDNTEASTTEVSEEKQIVVEEKQSVVEVVSSPSVPVRVDLDDDAEAKIVSAIELTESDSFDKINPLVLGAFGKIQEFSKTLNILYTKPEFVVVGAKGSGKTTLIEALFRKTLLVASSNVRPLTLHINHRDDPNQFVLRKDYSLREYSEDIVLSPNDVRAAIEQRNVSTTRYDPIVLSHTTVDNYPAAFFDTVADNLDKIQELVKPSQRIIIVVVDCRDIAAAKPFVTIAKQVDPTSARSVFVYTHANSVFQGFQNSRDVAKFFGSVENGAYFVTLPSEVLKTDEKVLSDVLLRLARRDKSILEDLQADKKYFVHVGVAPLSKWKDSACWKHYQSQLPIGLQSIRKQIVISQRDSENMKQHLANLSTGSQAVLATQSTNLYSSSLHEVLRGTVEASTILNGQTLEEEQQRAGLCLSDTLDLSSIPHYDRKLSGAQQFVRLLAEFKGASLASRLPSGGAPAWVAAGPFAAQNLAWSVSDYVKQHSQNVFIPLIERLILRSTYIFGRLPNIVISILETKKLHSTETQFITDFPYFLNRLGEYFSLFIDSVANETLLKCRDEFYSTKTLCWDLTEQSDIMSRSTLPADWADELFQRIKLRIVRNVLAKMYAFFLNPIESALSGFLQTKICSLSQDELADLFKLTENRKKCDEAQKALEKKVQKLVSQETLYKQTAAEFAYQK